jgi:hypothetical protein
LKVLNCSINILNTWSGLMCSTKWDQMCLVHLLSVLNRITTNNRWHTMPFEDTPNTPTLASECRGLFPTPGSTPDTTCRSADKAGPQTQALSLPPACHAPLETMVCPCALLPQDLFPRSPTLTLSAMSQPWSIWPRLCQIYLLIAFLQCTRPPFPHHLTNSALTQ